MLFELLVLLAFIGGVLSELPRGSQISSVIPSEGPGAGKFRVSIRGRNLPIFPFQARVMLEGGGECTGIAVEKNFEAISCIMPECERCGDQNIKIVASSGEESNAIRFHYYEDCFDGSNPSLPRFYSGAENCTVCSSLVLLTLAAAGDVVTLSTLRAAMQDVCSSSLLRTWGRVESLRCRTDYTPACFALFHTAADVLLDSMYMNWGEGYMSGELSRIACVSAGQCGPDD